MKTVYEWDVETVDPDSGDVLDHDHADTLRQLVHWKKSDEPFDLVLVRDTWEEDGELVSRAHWYPGRDKMIAGQWLFSNGYSVPKRFIEEYQKTWIG